MADAGKGFRGAGKAPDGDRFFWATLEPIGSPGRWPWDPPGALIFYAYWWKMKPDGRGNYWGNWFQPKPDQVPKRETWVCVEWRVKANTAGKDDGELWLEGTKYERSGGGTTRSVWYDDVVVATKYIGPKIP